MPKNYMEDILQSIFHNIWDKYENICKCNRCYYDVQALALNNLQPLYAVTEQGKVYLKTKEFEIQFKVDVINEIVKAINVVSQDPKHSHV